MIAQWTLEGGEEWIILHQLLTIYVNMNYELYEQNLVQKRHA